MGFALSSLVVHTGRTAVLCSVCLEKVPRWRKGEGWDGSAPNTAAARIHAAAAIAELMKLSGRTQEIQRLIDEACAP